MKNIEVVPAILRNTLEGIREDWGKIYQAASHVQIDITDGIFAGDGSFRQVREFKKLPEAGKIELHMMVHTPANYVDDIIDLQPARCVFHLEAFAGTGDLEFVYAKLRQETQTELGLALNPASPNERLYEYVRLLNYVLFMGYNAGWAGQAINPIVFNKIREFRARYAEMPIEVDGQVDKQTMGEYAAAGATVFCSNGAIFKAGNPVENLRQLELLARAG